MTARTTIASYKAKTAPNSVSPALTGDMALEVLAELESYDFTSVESVDSLDNSLYSIAQGERQVITGLSDTVVVEDVNKSDLELDLFLPNILGNEGNSAVTLRLLADGVETGKELTIPTKLQFSGQITIFAEAGTLLTPGTKVFTIEVESLFGVNVVDNTGADAKMTIKNYKRATYE